jgi:hypothetical protein
MITREPRVYVKEHTIVILNAGDKSIEVNRFEAMQLMKALQQIFDILPPAKPADELENRLKAIEHRLVALEIPKTGWQPPWPTMNSPDTYNPYTITCAAGEAK